MYDWPELRDATDAWWSALAHCFRGEGLLDVPGRLDRSAREEALWAQPGLLFSQTCGFPLTHDWAGRLKVVATPCYKAPGCGGHNYSSAIMVRKASAISDLASLGGKTAVINHRNSLSGHLALQLVIAPLANGRCFFQSVNVSGSHADSLTAVRDGLADVCAIDAVVMAIARRYRPELLEGLVEIARSPAAPGLPYVTRHERALEDLTRLRRGLEAAFSDSSLAQVRDALFLDDISWVDTSDYNLVLDLEADAARQGYPSVA